jgi:photosystem II stability/assembly factor-like uncharacterized protein
VIASSFTENIGMTIDIKANRRGGSEFTINKTNDNGQSWSTVYDEYNYYSSEFIFWGKDLHLLNNHDAWVVGYLNTAEWDSTGPALLRTADGGENWDLAWKQLSPDYTYPAKSLNSVCGINNTFWAVGDNGLVITTQGADSIYVLNKFTRLSLYEVFFSDEKHGWIYAKSKIFRTKNGGESWQGLLVTYSINDMFFADSLCGWTVGSDTSGHGIIWSTTDGGDNWMIQVDGLVAPLHAIQFNGKSGWAVGDLGLILKTDDGGGTWIDEKTNKKFPDKFILSQNYPNPFNPKTTISYQLPVISQVELSIYNILGQRIANLVSEKQPAGTYNVEWDASRFASGIYLYQLKTENGFLQTKKLVVLK